MSTKNHELNVSGGVNYFRVQAGRKCIGYSLYASEELTASALK